MAEQSEVAAAAQSPIQSFFSASGDGDIKLVVVVLVFSMVLALAGEFLNWFMIYRHEEYQNEVEEVVDLQDKVEALRERISYAGGAQSGN